MSVPGEIRSYVESAETRSPEHKEGRVYDTTISIFMANLKERLSSFEKDRQEKLEPLISDIEKAAFGYIKKRMQHLDACRLLKRTREYARSPLPSKHRVHERDKSVVKEADRARKYAHERLLDSITIAARNIVGPTVEDFGSLDKSFAPLVDRSNPNHRHIVAECAIDLVFKKIDEEDWEERQRNLQKKIGV